MKKRNFLNILLELIVLFGHLIIGVTVVTFLMQGESINRIFIGLILMAMGSLQKDFKYPETHIRFKIILAV